MKLRFALYAILGVALGTYLVMYVGWRDVLSAAVAIGWGGFALFCLCSLALFMILGAAWRVLLPPGSGFSLWVLVRARMVRDSAAEVLPFSQLGGIALGVRAAILHGLSAPLACASMIVDVTTELLAQIGFIGLGIALLSTRLPHSSVAASVTSTALTTLLVGAIAAGLFIAVQRYAPRITGKLATPLLRNLGGTITGIGAALDSIYRSPIRVVLAVAVHLTAWTGSALAAWLGLRLMGAHIDVAAVIAIESLVYAVRSVAAVVPNALGVQEAAYAFLAPLLGLSPELGLALSVLKRARDVVVGVPILLLWQAAEGRHALGRPPAPTN